MPLQIQRTAQVYRLWDDADFRACLADHADAGWICMLEVFKDVGAICWRVSLQHTPTRTVVTATLDEVIVSDLVTVTGQSVADYNLANPDHQIGAGS